MSTDELKQKGITCSSCWWREGDRCYVGTPEREESGRSKVFALEVCDQHKSKRSVFANLFPPSVNVTIVSEENAKKQDRYKDGNY